MAKVLTRKKAKSILRHGKVRGRKLTKRARGFMGAVASGKSTTRGAKRAKARKA